MFPVRMTLKTTQPGFASPTTLPSSPRRKAWASRLTFPSMPRRPTRGDGSSSRCHDVGPGAALYRRKRHARR